MDKRIRSFAVSTGSPTCRTPDCPYHPVVFVADVSQSDSEKLARPAWLVAAAKANENGFEARDGEVYVVEINAECPVPRGVVLRKDRVVRLGFDWDWLTLVSSSESELGQCMTGDPGRLPGE